MNKLIKFNTLYILYIFQVLFIVSEFRCQLNQFLLFLSGNTFQQNSTFQQLQLYIKHGLRFFLYTVMPGLQVINPGFNCKNVICFFGCIERCPPRIITQFNHGCAVPFPGSGFFIKYIGTDMVMAVCKNIGCYIHPLAYGAFGRIATAIYFGLNIFNYYPNLAGYFF